MLYEEVQSVSKLSAYVVDKNINIATLIYKVGGFTGSTSEVTKLQCCVHTNHTRETIALTKKVYKE